MAGSLIAGTIVDENGKPVDLTGQEGAKAWANLNGVGTIAIRDSFNISSVTDINTGNYTFNFTNGMNGIDFSANVSGSDNNAGNYYTHAHGYGYSPNSVSATSGAATSSSHLGVDVLIVEIAVFGRLA
ncbi:MAG: hypothetical protein JKY49_18285 [Cohaesibacteraceae bacterium]|nr:hypothetical protein [Cohaesibacteraceae bacterium]